MVALFQELVIYETVLAGEVNAGVLMLCSRYCREGQLE